MTLRAGHVTPMGVRVTLRLTVPFPSCVKCKHGESHSPFNKVTTQTYVPHFGRLSASVGVRGDE